MTLGYTKRAVLVSFAALVIALLGGLIGSLVALTLNGLPMRIPMGAFRFQVDLNLVGIGLALAAVIGLLGVAWPLLRATRVTINAIRQL